MKKEVERLVIESFHQVKPDAEISICYVYGYTHIVVDKGAFTEEDLKKISDLVFKKTKDWSERFDLTFYKTPSGWWSITIQQVFPPYKD